MRGSAICLPCLPFFREIGQSECQSEDLPFKSLLPTPNTQFITDSQVPVHEDPLKERVSQSLVLFC